MERDQRHHMDDPESAPSTGGPETTGTNPTPNPSPEDFRRQLINLGFEPPNATPEEREVVEAVRRRQSEDRKSGAQPQTSDERTRTTTSPQDTQNEIRRIARELGLPENQIRAQARSQGMDDEDLLEYLKSVSGSDSGPDQVRIERKPWGSQPGGSRLIAEFFDEAGQLRPEKAAEFESRKADLRSSVMTRWNEIGARPNLSTLRKIAEALEMDRDNTDLAVRLNSQETAGRRGGDMRNRFQFRKDPITGEYLDVDDNVMEMETAYVEGYYGPQEVDVPKRADDKWRVVREALEAIERSKEPGGDPIDRLKINHAEQMIQALLQELYIQKHTDPRDENYQIGEKLAAEFRARSEFRRIYLGFSISEGLDRSAASIESLKGKHLGPLLSNNDIMTGFIYYDTHMKSFYAARRAKNPESFRDEVREEIAKAKFRREGHIFSDFENDDGYAEWNTGDGKLLTREDRLKQWDKTSKEARIKKWQEDTKDWDEKKWEEEWVKIKNDNFALGRRLRESAWQQGIAEALSTVTGRVSMLEDQYDGSIGFSGGEFFFRRVMNFESYIKNGSGRQYHSKAHILYPRIEATDRDGNRLDGGILDRRFLVDIDAGDYFSKKYIPGLQGSMQNEYAAKITQDNDLRRSIIADLKANDDKVTRICTALGLKKIEVGDLDGLADKISDGEARKVAELYSHLKMYKWGFRQVFSKDPSTKEPIKGNDGRPIKMWINTVEITRDTLKLPKDDDEYYYKGYLDVSGIKDWSDPDLDISKVMGEDSPMVQWSIYNLKNPEKVRNLVLNPEDANSMIITPNFDSFKKVSGSLNYLGERFDRAKENLLANLLDHKINKMPKKLRIPREQADNWVTDAEWNSLITDEGGDRIRREKIFPVKSGNDEFKEYQEETSKSGTNTGRKIIDTLTLRNFPWWKIKQYYVYATGHLSFWQGVGELFKSFADDLKNIGKEFGK